MHPTKFKATLHKSHPDNSNHQFFNTDLDLLILWVFIRISLGNNGSLLPRPSVAVYSRSWHNARWKKCSSSCHVILDWSFLLPNSEPLKNYIPEEGHSAFGVGLAFCKINPTGPTLLPSPHVHLYFVRFLSIIFECHSWFRLHYKSQQCILAPVHFKHVSLRVFFGDTFK